jgi:O-antigen/teichoic acid export membrane protein
MTDTSARTLRGAHLAGAGWMLTQGLNLAAYIVLARLITPESFGHFAEASVVIGVGSLFAESGIMAALIHREDRMEEAASTAVISTFATGLLLCPLGAATAPLLGLLFGSEEVTSLALVLSGWLFFRAATVVPDTLLQRRFSFVRRVVVEPLGVIAFAVTSVLLASAGHGAWALVAGMYASIVTQATCSWAFARWRPRLRLASFAMWRELMGYARYVFASEVLRRFAGQLDVLALGTTGSPGGVGQYRNGLRLARQAHDGWVAVAAYVLLPTFARMREDPARLRHAVDVTLATMFMLVAPLVALMVAVGHPGTLLVLGSEWGQAGFVVVALAGFVAGGTFISLASEVLKATGYPQLLTRTHVATLATTVVCVPALAWLGPVGAAAGVSLSSLLTAAYAATLLRTPVGLRLRTVAAAAVRPYCAAALAAGTALAAGALADDGAGGAGPAYMAPLLAALTGAVYVVALRILDPSSTGRLLALRPRRMPPDRAAPTQVAA